MLNKYVHFTGSQQLVHYGIQNTNRSYTLPQLSTVIGLIHNLMGWKTYHKMNIAISADVGPVVNNLQTFYYYSLKKYDPAGIDANGKLHRGYHQLFAYNDKGTKIGITRGVANVEELSYINLSIYVFPEDEDEVSAIEKALIYPKVYPRLGRQEDLLDIDKVETGTAKEFNGEIKNSHCYQYVPAASIDDLIDYQLRDSYPILKNWNIDEETNTRIFSRIKGYVVSDAVAQSGVADEKQNLIFPL